MAFSSQTGVNLGDIQTDLQLQLIQTQEWVKRVFWVILIVVVLSWLLMSLKR